jgi:hypothetical protein
MKTVLIIVFTTLIALTCAFRIRQPGQGNCELIKAFLEQVVNPVLNTKKGVYSTCIKLLCEEKDNLSNRRQFTTYITELVNRQNPIVKGEIMTEFGGIENKVDSDEEKGVVCGIYLKKIIKTNEILKYETPKTYEVINSILGKTTEALVPKAMNTNLYTTNRGSGLINDGGILKKLNGQ